jgi:MoaA/NifB/PqqE/SkfB family radical SAM enzyme
MTNGEVTPCVFVPLPYGNIHQHNLSEIWKAIDDYVKEYKIRGQCPMCDPFLREKLFEAIEQKSNLEV